MKLPNDPTLTRAIENVMKRSRLFDEACRATLANDGPAFRKAMDEFHREQQR
jgi:hypothetical protein